MKIRIASDLHLEVEECASSPSSGRLATALADDLQAGLGADDLLILAGDTHNRANGVKWVKRHFAHLDTLMIDGNHEFYGARFPRQTRLNQLRAKGTKIRYLENQAFQKGGYHFFGATLWTDYAAFCDSAIAMMYARKWVKDFQRIRLQTSDLPWICPEDLLAAHQESRQAIITFLESKDPSKCVVVTHHAPSPKSVNASYRANDPVNGSFASDLERIIGRFQPRLWVHGHMHLSCRYNLGDTEVICNPRGYGHTPNPEFNSELTVEL